MNEKALINKNCFVTGATGGLGTQISLELARKDCNLFLTSRDQKNLDNLCNQILKVNKKIDVKAKAGNLAKIEDINYLIKEARLNFQSIDILINCAGILPIKLIEESNVEDFDNCFNINFRAPFLLTKEFSQDMKKRKWGRIVNIASSGAYNGQKKTIVYRATKHALLGFSKAVHREMRDFNVRTYCISSGPLKTKMGSSIIPKLNADENYETFINPHEIAEFITHLMSYDDEMFSEEIRLGRIIGEK